MASDYSVELTRTAEETYRRLYEEAQACIKSGDVSNSKVTFWKMVDEAIDRMIPHDPFNPERALKGPLSNIFKIAKGRIRICYVASSKLKRIVVLYISETPRKEGDVRDPYSIFTRLVLSGKFDEVFARLGVRKPPRQPSEFLAPVQIQ